jgi:general secretion pathway protein N
MTRLAMANLAVWAGSAALAVGAGGTLHRAEEPVARAAPAALAEPRTAALDLPGPEAIRAVAERPLFSEDRRPPKAPSVAPAAAPAAEPLALRLVGVAGRPDDLVAIVVAGERTLRLRVGDRVAGHSVTAVEPDLVRVEGRVVPLLVPEGAPAPSAEPSRPRAPEGSVPPDGFPGEFVETYE